MILLSILIPKMDKFTATSIAFILFYFGAYRATGFDYTEYLNILYYTANIDPSFDFFQKLVIAARDPFIGFLAYGFSLINDNEVFMFKSLIFVAVFIKLLFSFYFKYKSSLFLGLYALLLAPGLEFAAIRTSIGLGFIAFVFIYYNNIILRYLYISLGIASHASLLSLGMIFFFEKLIKKSLLINYIIISVSTYFSINIILYLLPDRVSNYIDSASTLGNYIFPFLILILLIIMYRIKKTIFTKYVYQIALFLHAIVIGITPINATITTRMLEIDFFIILIFLISSAYSFKTIYLWISLLLFILIVLTFNSFRGLFLVINSFNINL